MNETLREFIKRFSITIWIADNPSDEVAIMALLSGLKGNNFTAKLARKPPSTLVEAVKCVYQEMDDEELLDGKFREAQERVGGNKSGEEFKRISNKEEGKNSRGIVIIPKSN